MVRRKEADVPVLGSVTVDIDGKSHTAAYSVSDDRVTVRMNGRKKSAMLGDLSPEDIARGLVFELVGSQ